MPSKDIMRSVFYAFFLLFALLWIVNAPFADGQQKYFLWGWTFAFLLLPVSILHTS